MARSSLVRFQAKSRVAQLAQHAQRMKGGGTAVASLAGSTWWWAVLVLHCTQQPLGCIHSFNSRHRFLCAPFLWPRGGRHGCFGLESWCARNNNSHTSGRVGRSARICIRCHGAYSSAVGLGMAFSFPAVLRKETATKPPGPRPRLKTTKTWG